MEDQTKINTFLSPQITYSRCEYCGKKFRYIKKPNKYCSSECYHKSKITNYEKKCPECGETKKIVSGSLEWTCKVCGRHWAKSIGDIKPLSLSNKQITVKRPENLKCPHCGEMENIVSRGLCWNCKSCKRKWVKKEYKRKTKKISSFKKDLYCPNCGEQINIYSQGPYWQCRNCGKTWMKLHQHTWNQTEHSKLKNYAKEALMNRGYSSFEFEVPIMIGGKNYRIDCVAQHSNGKKVYIECGELDVEKLIFLLKKLSVIWFSYNKECYLFKKDSVFLY